MSGGGDHHTVSFVQTVRAALVLSRREQVSLLVVALIFGAAALLPVFNTGYWLSIGVSIAMFTVLATSWALVLRPDQLHRARRPRRSSASACTSSAAACRICRFRRWSRSPAVVGALFAAVVGLATLRISGVYFVIFTLGLAELVRQIVAWAQHVMGTSSGLYVLIGDFRPGDVLAAARHWPRWSI